MVRAASRVRTGNSRGYDVLSLWVVTDHPSDFPGHFVARRWTIADGAAQPTDVYFHDAALAPLQERLRARGLFRLDRAPGDDPVIVEVWL